MWAGTATSLAARARWMRRAAPCRGCRSLSLRASATPEASRAPRSSSQRRTAARRARKHPLDQPWRFRILGPETLAELKRVAGEKEAQKLDRAPTLVVVSAVLTGDLVMDEEGVCATAAAIMLVLLASAER